MRRTLLAASLLATLLAPLTAFAQAPPAVPALPDSERRTSYSITGSTCACAVNFALYGDGTDVDSWLQVWINGTRYLSTDPTFGWSLSSVTGPLSTIPRPITDAVLTFNNVQTGTVQIVGARRPRQLSQFQEGRGVAARDLNQRLTDITAIERELWDKTSDLTGRGLFSQPGNVMGPLPIPSACHNAYIAFDLTGLNPVCLPGPSGSGGNVSGPGTSIIGDIAVWGNATGTLLADAKTTGAVGAAGLIVDPLANTTNQAVVTSSTAPLSGSQSADFNFSEFDATNNGYKINNALDSVFGGLASNSTLRANYTSGTSGNVNSAIWGAARETAPSANLTGITGSAYTNISAPSDFLWGVIGFGNVGASGSVNTVIGIEAAPLIATGGAATNRVGFSADSQSPTQGSTLDAAFAVTHGSSAGIAPYNSSSPWLNAFVISSGIYGLGAPLATTGNVLYSPDTFTTGSFANFANITFTGNLFNFPNFAVSGAGRGVIGAGAASIPSSPIVFVGTCASCGQAELIATPNGTSGQDGFQAQTSTFSNLTVAVGDSSNTGSFLGQGLGNLSVIEAYGSTSGLAIGTLTNTPLILGTNNAQWMTLSGAGSFAFSGPITETIGQNAGTLINVVNGNPGASAFTGFGAGNTTNTATFGMGGTAYTAIAGLQNRAFINANSTAAGIILNNQGANPIVFGINALEAGRFDSSTIGQLDLGVAGTTTGRIQFANTTSGTITLQPVTGALGTVTLSLPAATDTLVGRATTDTLTNKTISGSSNTLSNISTNANFQLGSGVATGLAAGATDYAGFAAICGSAAEASCFVPVSAPATMKNFYAVAPGAAGTGQSYTFTVRRNSLSTSITCTISGASATNCNDTTHTQAFSAGDTIDVQMVASAGAAVQAGYAFTMTAVTTSP